MNANIDTVGTSTADETTNLNGKDIDTDETSVADETTKLRLNRIVNVCIKKLM